MIHCFYHSADLDGHCSGAIVKYRFPDAVMHPINYGNPFPWDEIQPEDEVYMVDFALQPFDDMVKLATMCRLVWVDHHKSTIDTYNNIVWVDPNPFHEEYLDTTRAACELTWNLLFSKPVPLAVKLLSLYDSWTYQGHELEDMVLPFQMRMRMEDLDPGRLNKIRDSQWIKYLGPSLVAQKRYVAEYVEEGRLLLRYEEAQKEKYAKTYAFETEFHGTHNAYNPNSHLGHYKAIAINLGHTNSKVFDSVWRRECGECGGGGMIYDCLDHTGCISYHKLPCPTCHNSGYIEPYDIMIAFCRRSDKLWNVSLCSTKENIDCGAIAKSFGGGGHKGAAGFQCSNLPFEF